MEGDFGVVGLAIVIGFGDGDFVVDWLVVVGDAADAVGASVIVSLVVPLFIFDRSENRNGLVLHFSSNSNDELFGCMSDASNRPSFELISNTSSSSESKFMLNRLSLD